MPRYALETIGLSATAPGAAPGAAAAAVTGDSLRIRDSKAAWLVDIAHLQQADGSLSITSPLLHDTTVGIARRVNTGSAAYKSLPVWQQLLPQDLLTATIIGSATAGDVELGALTIMYEDLGGIDANVITANELTKRNAELFSIRPVVTTTAAGWTGSVALNAVDNQFKANMEYAWIGANSISNADALMVGMQSPDFGNLRIGCPIEAVEPQQTDMYFVELAARMDMPLIPVINANQIANIFLTCLGNENGAATNLTLNFARLTPRGRK